MSLFGHSVVSNSVTWTVASQAPLFVEFPIQESWSGLPFPFPGDLPDPGIEPGSPALGGGFFTAETPGRPSPGRTLGYVPAQIVPMEFILLELEGGWKEMKYK